MSILMDLKMYAFSCVILSLMSVAWAQPYRHVPTDRITFNLYKSLSTKYDGENIFFSPMSVATALSMLALGSGGETHSQLFSALGYSHLTQDQVDMRYEHLSHTMIQNNEHLQLDMGNALVLREDFQPLAQFLTEAKHHYSSDVLLVDFNNIAQAEAKINQFIAQKTQDKITNLVKGLSSDTSMLLINYIFFRGKWLKPFDPSMTIKADFHVDENTTVEVDMMRMMSRFDYYHDDNDHTTILTLPYIGDASMMIILPGEGKMKVVEGYIIKRQIKDWRASLITTSVNLAMPKISISASSSLDDALKEMGVVDAFGHNANFSGIFQTSTPLRLSKVKHQAVLKVDETGTEAAAVNILEMIPMSLPHSVNLNRPFLLLITEDSTDNILFMGKVSNPTAK